MWYNDYVGIPFLDKGREKTGADCWGLVRLIYDEQFNVKLPSFADADYDYADDSRIEDLFAQNREGWEVTTEPKPGSLVLFRILGREAHVGVYIGDDRFIHSRDKFSSAIENLSSTKWRSRTAGFFNYTENKSAVLNAVPHPLKTDRWTIPVIEGTTVQELSEQLLIKFEIPAGVDSNIVVIINGVLIPKSEYSTTTIKNDDVIEYRAVAKGDFLKLALIITLTIMAPGMGAAMAGAITGTTAAAAVGTGLAMGLSVGIAVMGNLLIGMIMPVRIPKMTDPGSAANQLLMTGTQNQINKYGTIPFVLGKIRMTAPLGAQNFIDSDTDTSYLSMILLWGYGPLSVTDLHIGMSSVDQYDSGVGIPISYTTLNGKAGVDDAGTISSYESIYGVTRNQIYSGVTLACNPTVGVPSTAYNAVTLTQIATTKIEVTFNFPQGLRKIKSSTGSTFAKEVQFSVEYQLLNADGSVPAGSVYRQMTSTDVPQNTIVLRPAWADATTYSDTYGGAISRVNNNKYRWYRIGIDTGGTLFVLVGAICSNQNAAILSGIIFNLPGSGPTAADIAYQKANTYAYGTPTSYVTMPALSEDQISIVDICMFGNTVSTTSIAARRSDYTYTGFSVSTAPETSNSINPTTWVTTGAGGLTGNRIATITSGTLVRNTANYSVGLTKFNGRKDAFSYTVGQKVPAGRYRVQVRRLTDDRSDLEDKYMAFSTLVLQTVTGSQSGTPIIEPLDRNPMDPAFSTVRLTRTAIRVRATNQLNGNIEGINALVQTICPDWTPATSTWDVKATNNPASLFLYVLQHPANPFRVKQSEVLTKINKDAIRDWWIFCNAQGFTFNDIVAQTRSVLDILRDIAAAGRGSPAMVDGKWTIILDTLKTGIIQHFTPHNSWGFESSKMLPKIPDGLKVTFLNEEMGYQQDELIVYNTNYGPFNNTLPDGSYQLGIIGAEIFEQISLPGTTNIRQANIHARWHYAQAKLRPELYSLNTDLEYLVCNRGDRVKVRHDVPMWGTASGRIKDVVYNTVVPTGISGTGTTATATFATQTSAIYAVGSNINMAGASVAGYNGTQKVTACTTNSVSWGSATSTASTILSNITVSTTAISTVNRVSTATFATTTYIPYAIGSTITISGVTPAGYNGIKVITACTPTSVSWYQDDLGASTINGSIVGKSSISTPISTVFKLLESVPLVANTNYSLRVRPKTGTGNSDITTIGYISGTTLTITSAPVGGILAANVRIDGAVLPGTTIVANLTGTGTSATSTWTVTPSQTSGSIGTPIALTGNTSIFTVQQVTTTNSYTTITVSPAATASQIDVDDLFMFGEINSESQDLLVLKIEPFGDKNAKVTLVDYAPQLFDINYISNNFKLPNFTTGITNSPQFLVKTITTKPFITKLTSNESVMEKVAEGVFKFNLAVNFVNPFNLPQDLESIEGQIDAATDTTDNWSSSVYVPAKQGSINFPGVEETSTYKVRLRYISRDGRQGPWQQYLSAIPVSASWAANVLTINTLNPHSFVTGNSISISNVLNAAFNGTYTITGYTSTEFTVALTTNPGTWTSTTLQDTVISTINITHTIVGKSSLPESVTGFTATPEYLTGSIIFNWVANPEVDIRYYEVRSDLNWGTAVGTIFLGSALTCTTIPGALGVLKTYYIKAIDYSTNYSLNPTSITYTVVAPPAITATPSYAFNTTSATDTNITIKWVELDPTVTTIPFQIQKYELTLVKPSGTVTYIVAGNQFTTIANWVGNTTLTIKSIDVLNNKSTATSPTVTINKTVPGTVATVTITPTNNSIVLKWPAASAGSVPIDTYEIRTDLSWGTAGYIWKGAATTTSIVIPQSTTGTLTYYIKAIDIDNQYSATATTISYSIPVPTTPTFNAAVFADTSLTNATVTLSWSAITLAHGLYGYELSYGTTVQTINTTTITLPANWGIGDRTYSLKTIDNLGNKSTVATQVVSKLAPGIVTNFTAKIIDNNVLLYWTPPVKTTLPIDHISIVKGTSYAGGTSIGDKTGTFTTVLEQTGGTYTYWIAAIDTDGQVGTAVSLVATVAQPPDYVFNAQYTTSFTSSYLGAVGANTNSFIDTGGAVLPVDTGSSVTYHFTGSSKAWTTPQAQIDAGFPIYIQPATSSGVYEEVFNYTKPLASSQITLSYSGTIFNAPTIIPTISTAAAGSTGTGTVSNSANGSVVTGVSTAFGTSPVLVGSYITIPNTPTGQTVRIVSITSATNMIVSPIITTANSGVNYYQPSTWTDYVGATSALGTAFQYVKAKISATQNTKNAVASSTVSAATAVGPSLDLQFTNVDKIDSRITFTRASIGSYYDSTGILRVVSADVPRLDYDPITLQPKGLLIEEARTNLITYSGSCTTAPWGGDTSGGSIPTATANYAIAPDGTLSATRLQINRGAGTYSRWQQGLTVTSAIFIGSIWMRTTSGIGTANVGLRLDTTGVNCVVTGQWTRFSVAQSTATTVPALQVLSFTSIAGTDITADILIWGGQVEPGAFATSYIPTTTAQVTRAIDVARINTLTPWFSATEGTLVANSTRITSAVSVAQGIVGLAAASGIDSIYIYSNAASNTCEIVTSAASVAGVSIAYNIRSAITYKLNDTNGAAGGTVGTTDTACTIPTIAFLQIGNIQGAGNVYPLNGWVSSVTYFPRRLVNADLALVSGTGQVTVTGTGAGTLFTKTFRVGDTITIPNTAAGIDYSITGIASDTVMGVMVPVNITMPTISASTYAFKGTDLYKLTNLGVRLDAKQKTESNMVTVNTTGTPVATDGAVVNFTGTFIDVSSITLAPLMGIGGPGALIPVYNFIDSNLAGTYTNVGTACSISIAAHGLSVGQNVNLTFTGGVGVSNCQVTILAGSFTSGSFTVTLPTTPSANNTTQPMTLYPNSMTVYLYNDSGTRVAGQVSWTVRGF